MKNKKKIFKQISILLSTAVIVNLLTFNVTPLYVSAGRGGGTVADTSIDFPANGVLEADKYYKVKGNVSLTNLFIPEDTEVDLTGGSLNVTQTLENHGEITVEGDFFVSAASLYNYGRIDVDKGFVSASALLYNSGKIYAWNDSYGIGHLYSSGMVLNEATGIIYFESKSDSDLENSPVFNKGSIKNDSELLYTEFPKMCISAVDSKVQPDYYTDENGGAIISAPSPYTLWIDENGSWSKVYSNKTIGSSQTISYCIAASDSASISTLSSLHFSECFGSETINIKTKASLPGYGDYYNLSDSAADRVYMGSATISPAYGYNKIHVYDKTTGTDLGDGASVTINRSFANLYGRLIDADNQESDEFPIGKIIVLDNDCFEIDGRFGFLNSEEQRVYVSNVTIKAKDGYKLSFDKSSEESSITVSQTMEEAELYLKSSDDTFGEWAGPIPVESIIIEKESPVPSDPYTLEGTKYKQNSFKSDVVLKPAAGYKVTTSKDKTPVDSIKFTGTAKNVKIYLYDEFDRFTKEISVGDIMILREGKGEVFVDAQCYGGKLTVTTKSDTHDPKLAKIVYKTADGNTLNSVPSAVGKYTVEVTFPDNDNYQEYTARKEFAITYLPSPTKPYSIEGIEGENDFYTSDVTIIPTEGYSISRTLGSDYSDSLTFNADSKNNYVYLRKNSTGEMTEKIAVKEIMIDKESPFITDLTDNQIIYTDAKQVIVKDDNLLEVFVNGDKVPVVDNAAVIDLISDNGIMEYTIVMTDKAGNKSTIFVTLFSEWMEEGNVKEGVPLKLYPGMVYNFPEGSTWSIEGDPTVYRGGNSFIVTENVEITFNRN